VWWFILTVAFVIAALVVHIQFGQRLGFSAWPFLVAALIFSLFAWWLFQVDGAEVGLLRAAVASVLIAWGLYGETFAWTPRLFPANELSRYVRSTADATIRWWPPPAITSRASYFSPGPA